MDAHRLKFPGRSLPFRPASLAFKAWLVFAAFAAFPSGMYAAPLPAYFRSDLGIASREFGPLPDRFDIPNALRWRVPMDTGRSTPTIWGHRLFLTTFNRERKELATVAVDKETGQTIWKKIVPASEIEEVHPAVGNPAASTIACDGERIFALFGSYGLLCYDLGGNLVWEHKMGPFQDEYGANSSPVLVEDLVIVQQDHDIGSFIMALNRFSGNVVWKTARPDAVRSYSTPAVWESNGVKQLVVAGSIELAGYSVDTGRKLWWVNGLARIVIPAPIPKGDTIFMASWAPGGDAGRRIAFESWSGAIGKWDGDKDGKLARNEVQDPQVLDRFFRMDLDQDGRLSQAEWDRHAAVFVRAENAALAIRPAGAGDLTEKAVVWKAARGAPYVATPLLDGEIFWMIKDGGIVTKLDAANGAMLSDERLPAPGNYYASPVTGDGKVYFAGETGTLSVVANAKDWRVISSHNFGENIYATPVADRGRIYVRTEAALYRFDARPE